jgi:glycine cleavage system aminomethyltransferase T
VDLGYARVRATRITYVGELGWEFYVPTEFAACVYEALLDAGAEHGLRHVGYHALDSLRMEKGYRHWGHDITDEDTPTEAGLGFAVAWDKPGGFLGRDALLRARGRPPGRRLVGLALDDPGLLLLGNEPVWRDGAMVGRVTSAAFGHTLGRSVGLGYVACPGGVTAEWLAAGRFAVEIARSRHAARASLTPFYDPANARVRC